MIARRACILLLLADVVQAASPIPTERRIPARVVTTMAAPVSEPMHMPTDLALNAAGDVFVADGVNNRVVRFGADGQLKASITQTGGQRLNRPVGLFVDAQERLWIADSGNHRVLVVPREPGDAEVLAPEPLEQGNPFEPTDIVVAPDGKRAYIVDNENHRLVIRENETGKWTLLGRFGAALGQFRWPFMIAMAPDGYVYISEAIGARAQRLSPRDQWAGQIGRWGVELGQLYRPKGIAIDAKGRVYIGDSTMHVVQVFGARGSVEGVLTGEDGAPLRLKHPMGMAFDARGRLYVVEMTADRVAVLSLPDAVATRPAGGGASR